MTGAKTSAATESGRRVVDASFIAAIVFGDSALEVAELDWDAPLLVAPSIIRYEFMNVCVKKQRTGRIDAERALVACQQFESLSIATEYVSFPETLATAIRYRLSGYDAAYLWMALEYAAPLLTLDQQLHKAWQLAMKEVTK